MAPRDRGTCRRRTDLHGGNGGVLDNDYLYVTITVIQRFTYAQNDWQKYKSIRRVACVVLWYNQSA